VATLSLLLLADACPAQQFSAVRYANRRYTVCTVDLSKQRLELFWRDGAKKPFRSFDALNQWLQRTGRKLVFATNAGMYREDFSPVGLYVEGGRQLRPLNLASGKGNFCLKPNGVFALTKSGARIVESTQYATIKASTTLATQSGPMLVLNGRLHPKFSSKSQSRLFRNGVGVVSAQKVIFAITEDAVNFHEFASFFRDRLKCRNALYLDGSISGLYAPSLKRDDRFFELGPMLGVTVKAR